MSRDEAAVSARANDEGSHVPWKTVWTSSLGKVTCLPGTVIVYACCLRGMMNSTISFHSSELPGLDD